MRDQTRTAFGISDIGISRINNEDVWITLPENGFFAIADGMGGHKAGEVAAKETIDSLTESVKKIDTTDAMELIIEIRSMIERANKHVYEMGLSHSDFHGMGTTLCCLLWKNDLVLHAHVGDSRIYRLRNKTLSLLTEDHSLLSKWLSTGKLAESCETPFPYKNVITRSIGTAGKANPEIALATYHPGDLFFLCSDGISDVLSLLEIEAILNQFSTPEEGAIELINAAKEKEGSDNMTIIMVS